MWTQNKKLYNLHKTSHENHSFEDIISLNQPTAVTGILLCRWSITDDE